MSENKVCIKCQYNHYPECHGTIDDNGEYIKIDNLRDGFECGQKDLPMVDFSIKVQTKLEVLEARLLALESKLMNG